MPYRVFGRVKRSIYFVLNENIDSKREIQNKFKGDLWREILSPKKTKVLGGERKARHLDFIFYEGAEIASEPFSISSILNTGSYLLESLVGLGF